MNTPLATFTSRRFGRRDAWELHPGYLTCQRFFLGFRLGEKKFLLDGVTSIREYVVPHGLLLFWLPLMMIGALAWVGSVWIAGQSPDAWIPFRSIRLMVWGGLLSFPFACVWRRYFNLNTTPEMCLIYARSERERAQEFVGEAVRYLRATQTQETEKS